MNQLEYRININASKERVWSIMFGKGTYPQWVDVSWPTSYYEGEWDKGNLVRFISSDASGTLALVVEHAKFHYSKLKHIAALLPGGIEDRESEEAKAWIGTTESYSFRQAGDSTEILVEVETLPSWIKMFEEGWPDALRKLKEICEQ